MKINFVIFWARLACAMLWLGLLSGAACGATHATEWLRIPDGVPVPLVNDVAEVSGAHSFAGQSLYFHTVKAVAVAGVDMVRAGAVVTGTVIYAHGSGTGFRGELIVAIDSVEAVDGSWIPLRTTRIRSHRGDVIVPDSEMEFVAAKFPNGHNKVLRKGHAFDTYVDGTRTFQCSGELVSQVLPGRPRVTQQKTALHLLIGTTVKVRPVHDVSSAKMATGDPVDFTVVSPVIVDDRTAIALLAPARGAVLLSLPKRLGGGGGTLVVSIDAVQTVDGQWVRVRSTPSQLGPKNVEVSSVVAILIPIGTALVPGKEAVLSAAQEFTASVYQSTWITAPRSGTPDVVGPPPLPSPTPSPTVSPTDPDNVPNNP